MTTRFTPKRSSPTAPFATFAILFILEASFSPPESDSSRTGWFVMTFGLLLFYYRLIFREEAALNAEQGQSFRNYCAAVPRFFPALRPRVPSSGAKPRWGQAFGGELFIWGFAAGVVAFAITFNQALCWIITSASFVGYLVYWLISSRLAKSGQNSQEPGAPA